MNEQRFVAFLQRNFPFSAGKGIGDDCSIFIPKEKGKILITTDLLVENVHFRREWFTPRQLALKSLAVNLSDIAAMGGIPLHFYLALALPADCRSRFYRQFFSGLKNGCRRWKVELAGGDYSRSEKIVINITAVGVQDKPVLRSGAAPGDLLALTGNIGEAALGLELLRRGKKSGYFVRRHLLPQPQIEVGRKLASLGASAMIDLSDGLLIDLQRLTRSSGVGATVDIKALPARTAFFCECRKNGLDPLRLMLGGGEDYQLLFTFSEAKIGLLQNSGLLFYPIGRIEKRRGIRLRGFSGKTKDLASGYDHFVD